MSGKKFFTLYEPEKQYAFAMASKEISRLIIPKKGWVEKWEVLPLHIPKGSGIISDYLTSIVRGRLCSEKLRKIIEKSKGKTDLIQWLPVDIFNEETGETLKYHHLHFPEPPNCLSRKHCKFNPNSDRVMVPVYSYQRIKSREIFNSSGGYEKSATILSDNMRKTLEEAECTGLCLERAPVIYDEKGSSQQVAS